MKIKNNKVEKSNEIIKLLLQYGIRLFYFADDLEYLEYNLEITDEETVNEINSLIGCVEVLNYNAEKDGRECIETSIIYFKDYDLHIKEITAGECHYKDVSIDGDYTSKYILVQPVEIKKIEYVDYV